VERAAATGEGQGARAARTVLLASLALVAFAGNSVLCRLALAAHLVDAASFTFARLGSGAAILAVLAWRRRPRPDARPARTSWISAAALFAYAAPFSFAYLRLSTGTGALVLFGVVQATMIGWGIARGERPRALVWLGLAVAAAGLVALAAPGVSAPDPLGAAGMAIAGASWAIYSLRGRVAGGDPLLATASNFARSLPLGAALLAAAAVASGLHATPRGLALAVASGAITSGLGYSLWYAALPALTATRAAVLQLTVPLLAGLGGAVLLGERPSLRLVGAGVAILGGVALSLRGRS
jgi:drug/metabolite transporter (DMT)-like permease